LRAFILDLDGTLVDSVYQHVIAWHAALSTCGVPLPMWLIHRKIGMSGDLLLQAFAADLGVEIDSGLSKRLEAQHAAEFTRLRPAIKPLRGARELLADFRSNEIAYAIATSGDRGDVDPLLDMLELPSEVPIISKEQANEPKPDPELFLKASKALGSRSEDTMVVGDSVWDMLAARRAHFLGVGLLTGGYAEHEMTSAGAYRVYADPEDLRRKLHETGISIKERTNGT
jgi:HAD superfamily hydrolase (TIGR01549 family)